MGHSFPPSPMGLKQRGKEEGIWVRVQGSPWSHVPLCWLLTVTCCGEPVAGNLLDSVWGCCGPPSLGEGGWLWSDRAVWGSPAHPIPLVADPWAAESHCWGSVWTCHPPWQSPSPASGSQSSFSAFCQMLSKPVAGWPGGGWVCHLMC